jgi:hypothetical protein
MKIARLVFIIVLLASVVFVPGKNASANTDVAISISNGVPTYQNGMLTYPFTVNYGVTADRTEPVDAKITVTFDHPELIDSIVVTNAGGATVTTTGNVVTIEMVSLSVGSVNQVLTFNVTYNVTGSLPVGTVGSLPVNSGATATIMDANVPGSLPFATARVLFTIGAPASMISITADKTVVSVGQPIVFTVDFNTTAYTVDPVMVRVTVFFQTPDHIKLLKGATGGAVISGKTVTWEGELFPAGTGAQSFQFTAIAGMIPAGLDGSLNSYANMATATIVDVVNPGSLPNNSDTESFQVSPMKIFNSVVYMPATAP